MKNIRQALVQCLEASGGSGIPLPVSTPSSSVVNQLLDLGILDEEAFLSQLATRIGLGYVPTPLPDSADAPEMKRMLPPRVALKHRLLPLKIEDSEGAAKKLIVASFDPFDLIGRQAVARDVEVPVRWQIAPRKRILNAMRDFYGVGADTFEEILKGRDVDGADLEQRDEANIIFGAVIDDEMGDEVRITVVAAGFERWDDAASARRGASAAERPAAAESRTSVINDVFADADDDDDSLFDGDDDFDVPSFLK